MKMFTRVSLALLLLAGLLVAQLTPPKFWFIKVGGIIGEKASVRSEIDGVVQETNVVMPSVFKVPVEKQVIDFWFMKASGTHDLWAEIYGPGHRHGYNTYDSHGYSRIHVSIKKRQSSTDFIVTRSR